MLKKNKHIYAFLIVVFVFLIDRITKNIIVSYNIAGVSLMGGFLNFHYVENTGVAFGFLKGFNMFFILFNSLLLVFLLYMRRKTKDLLSFYALHFIIGGALGNIFDRIKHGYVVDFIDLKYFPAVFNMADFFITCGAVMIMFGGVKEEKCED